MEMASGRHKIYARENDDGDDEPMRRAFPVGDYQDEVDESIPPMDGEDYLRRVRLEATRVVDVPIAKLDLEQFKKNQTLYGGKSSDEPGVSESFLPDPRWQSQHLQRFSATRKGLVELARNMPSGAQLKQKDLPHTNDRQGWHHYCFGCGYTDPEDSEGDDCPRTLDKDCGSEGGMEPLLSVILSLDQVGTRRVLGHFVKWAELGLFSHTRACWMHALLSCLDSLLDSDTASVLQVLRQTLVALRRRFATEATEATCESDSLQARELMAACNILVTIISNYFGQRSFE